MSGLFNISALPEGTIIYYIYPEKPIYFIQNRAKMWLVQSILEWIFLLQKKIVVPLEDILEMHNVDNTLTEVAKYNASIRFHYIALALKICLDNLNEVNNGFTWIKRLTHGCHKMAKAGISKIINDKTVPKLYALFRLEGKILFSERRRGNHQIYLWPIGIFTGKYIDTSKRKSTHLDGT